MTGAMNVAGLFAGIGGIEHGLAASGHSSVLLADNLPEARAVLTDRFDAQVTGDVRAIKDLPAEVDVVTAGFPCQDLSSVGRKHGIEGTKSKLVGEVFRLLEARRVSWVLIENVPFLLHLNSGKAMQLLTEAFEELDYEWAYRVVDTQGFGLPQRRRRVVMVASTIGDPREVLFADGDAELRPAADDPAYGFYWTEGTRALGWAIDSVPPIKGGSSVGVPSPPAIVMPDGFVGTPDLRDAERLQGFPADWTKPAEAEVTERHRWRLVGNAVSVPVSEWLGHRLNEPGPYALGEAEAPAGDRWPSAAYSAGKGKVMAVDAGTYPLRRQHPPIAEFLDYPLQPLSQRATEGFLSRYRSGTLRQKPELIETLENHLQNWASGDYEQATA